MKTAGIIGGIGPESTIEYYRLLVASYRERTGDGSYPPILIDSIEDGLRPRLQAAARAETDRSRAAALRRLTAALLGDEAGSGSPDPP